VLTLLIAKSQLAAHCCVETQERASFLLDELKRKLRMCEKQHGLTEQSMLQCAGCTSQKAALTVAYCSVCDRNFCASSRPGEIFLGRRCFELHREQCHGAVAAFPRARCADLDWSQLGSDGKLRDCPVKIVKSLLATKLRIEGKWRPEFRKLSKPELLAEVLKITRC